MAEKHLQDIQDIWQGILAAVGEPDEGWAWEYKLRQAQQSNHHEAYALEEGGLTQGLLYIETHWHRSQLARRKRLVYVESIESAPWNRTRIEDPPYLRGVGKALLLFARDRSRVLGYEGRVGLHAISEAESFYRHIKMPEYGADFDKGGLIYFEYGKL